MQTDFRNSQQSDASDEFATHAEVAPFSPTFFTAEVNIPTETEVSWDL
jgi:hypothetical protein